MSDDPNREALDALEAKLRAKRGVADKKHGEEHYSQAQLGWRMVTEMVAGIGIGFGIGYGLDLLLGTLPIFMVIFVLLGLAAGIKTMMATALEFQSQAQGAEASDRDEG